MECYSTVREGWRSVYCNAWAEAGEEERLRKGKEENEYYFTAESKEK